MRNRPRRLKPVTSKVGEKSGEMSRSQVDKVFRKERILVTGTNAAARSGEVGNRDWTVDAVTR